jgi:hypothetical protein
MSPAQFPFWASWSVRFSLFTFTMGQLCLQFALCFKGISPWQ